MAAEPGGARSAAAGVASAEAGVDAQCHRQSTARAGHGRRRVPKEEAVHEEGSGRIRRVEVRSLGQPATARVAAHAGSTGRIAEGV